MTSSELIFSQIQLAEASYADLWDQEAGTWISSPTQVASRLINYGAEGAYDLSPAQANALVVNWSVRHHQPDTTNGFSATLFQSTTNPGEYTLAIRGTTPSVDDLLVADFGGIAISGAAYYQIVDLYNYWQRLTTPEGQQVMQATLRVVQGLNPPEGSVVIDATVTANLQHFVVLEHSLSSETGLGINPEQLHVTGHSLGGHLAVAFQRLFPEFGADVYVANAAGFYDNATVNRFFDGLAGNATTWPENSVANMYGTAEINVITNMFPHTQFGERMGMFTESPYQDVFGHGIGKLTDAAAVFDLFVRLDIGLRTMTPAAAITTLRPIFEAASQESAATLETIVNALGDLFGAGSTITLVDDREALYERIQAIKDSLWFQQSSDFTGIVSLSGQDGSEIADVAREDIAYRYALVNLLPFAVTAVDAALYAPHNTNSELERESFTEGYLNDRAHMLSRMLARNVIDRTPVGPVREEFRDVSLGVLFHVNATNSDPARQYVFGGAEDDTLTGLVADDRLYGGGGNDSLYGHEGGDYLEGGAGNDHLDGGSGDDTLVGGAGSDTLIGGTGNDIYIIQGNDRVIDADGRGTLKDATGNVIAGLIQETPDGHVFVTQPAIGVSVGSDLTLTLADGSVVVIENHQSGDLGLQIVPHTAAPEPDRLIEGDLTPEEPTQYDELGNVVTVPSQIAADREDRLYDSAGNDRILGHGGDDTILATRGGHDRIDGGSGSDRIEAGEGNDVAIGGADSDIVFGDGGDDKLFADTERTLLDAYTLGETQAASGIRGDWLDGGAGNDTLQGDAGDDALTGGGGDDVLVGGGGNDYLNGDESIYMILPDWGMDRQVVTQENGVTYYMPVHRNVLYQFDSLTGGNDVLYGGAGDDWLAGSFGNDVLDGGADNDVLAGEHGDDMLFGGDGADLLSGDNVDMGDGYGVPSDQHGADLLDGGSGDDVLWGNGGADTLYGGADNDVLYGDDGVTAPAYHGNDRLYGDSGNDRLIGQGGDDWLSGGEGDDGLHGDSDHLAGQYHGHDVLYGDAGNDTLIGGGGNDSLFGGTGDDRLDGDAESVAEDMHGNDYLDGGSGNDLLRGQGGDDRLLGGTGADTLFGDAGDDHLEGGSGDDQLIGGDGNDTLIGGTGNDYLWGDAGHDTYHFNVGDGRDTVVDFAGNNRVVFGAGIRPETLRLTTVGGALVLQYSAQDSFTFYGAPTEYQFSDGTIVSGAELMARLRDPITQTGTAGADVMMGGSADDLLWGGRGDDALSGGAGQDHIFGEAGHDLVHGDGGNDVLYGDAGNDTLHGGAGVDSLVGGEGNDALYGGDGADKLWGLAGNDLLHGGDGDDELLGGRGIDTLIGGRGDDWLDGGSDGSKTYRFEIGDGRDTLVFSTSARRIEFGEGTAPGDIRLYLSPVGVQFPYVLLEYGESDSVYIDMRTGSGVLDYRFADGSVLTHAQLVGQAVQADRARYAVFGTAANDYLSAGNAPTLLEGGAGNDSLFGRNHDDVLNGGSGNDSLYGSSGSDTLRGGLGRDSLYGDAGSDLYVFERGDGQDTIEEYNVPGAGDLNILRFGSDILAGDVVYTRMSNDDLRVTIRDSDDAITVCNWFRNPAYRLQQIVYGDGALQDMAALDALDVPDIVAAPSGGLLQGDRYSNRLVGGAGNDTLDGGWGSDTLIGGAGSDVYQLQWARGSSEVTYEIHAPHRVIEYGTELNHVRLPMGVEFQHLRFERQGDDLVLSFQGLRNIDFATYNWEGNTDKRYAPGAMVLSGYYDGVDNWAVLNTAGDVLPMSQLMQQPAQPSSDLTQSAYETWLFNVRQGFIVESLQYGGWTQTGDNRLERATAQARDIYEQVFVETYGTGSNINRISGSYIYEQSPEASYPTPADAGTSIPYLADAAPDPTWSTMIVPRYDYTNLDANGNPTVVSYEFFAVSSATGTVHDPLLADYLDARQEGSVTVRLGGSYNASVVETLQADDLSNTIYAWGDIAVFAGGGDDLIDAQYAGGNDVGAFLHGGEGNDTVLGSYHNDVILAGPGTDFLSGGQGDDTYLIDPLDTGLKIVNEVLTGFLVHATGAQWGGWGGGSSLDTVEFGTGIGVDDLRISPSTITSDSIDGITLTGSQTTWESRDITWGDGSQTVRVILPNADEQYAYNGGFGVEYYRFSDGTVLDHAQFLSLGWTLPGDENANTLTGSPGDDRLQGMAGDDTLSGGDGDDRLETGTGFDFAYGGAGNDTLVGGDSTDGQWTLDILYGDEGDDLILGGSKDGHFYGGAGNDELRAGEGFQRLYGEAGEDTLIAGIFAGRLDGGTGADLMIGGAFGDEYWVDDPGDVIVESQDGGVDMVNSSVPYALGPHLERLNLIGTDPISGAGNDKDNTLIASDNPAANTLSGGLGNDTYLIDALDTIVESPSEGIDTVFASFSYVLGANLENLGLTGLAAIDGTGNDLDNRITGNNAANVLRGGGGDDHLMGLRGNDTLEGGSGADTMAGGYGNDLYFVDDPHDLVIELQGQGMDTVTSVVSYRLPANVERLKLGGRAAIDADGNDLGNLINGNAAGNVLAGHGGNDTLNGGAGDDTLIGGTGDDRLVGGRGSDRYLFGRGDGQDTVSDYNAADADPSRYGATTDVLQFDVDVAHHQLWFSRVGNHLLLQISGTEDRVLVENWYEGEAYRIEAFHAGDGYSLASAHVDQLVQAMAAFVPPTSGEFDLPAAYRTELDPVLAASWEAAA